MASVWIWFKLKDRPFRTPEGKPLSSVEGRRNKRGVDEFLGGGKIDYPDIHIGKIQERHEKDTDLLIKADLTSDEQKLLKGTIITDQEAEQMKKDIFKSQR